MIFNYFNAYILYPLAEKKMKRDIRSKVNLLKKEATLSRPERDHLTRKRLHLILSSAAVHVPYYKDLFKSSEFDPDSIEKDLRYLQDLPYLTKEIVREQGTRLLHQSHPRTSLEARKTGGSTGISTVVYYDHEALDWTAAVNLHAQSFTGRKLTDTEVHLSTHFSHPIPFKDRLKEQVKCWAMNRTNVLTQSFAEPALAEMWLKIRKIRPYLIQGHPSTLYALAKHIEQTKTFDRTAIRVFESTGESVDQKKITAIEKNVGCKVFNRYGTAEFGVTAHSRANPLELEIIESIIYHETLTLGDGNHELIGTTTTNFAMPLIRYRSGDVGKVEARGDQQIITELQGRVHDLLMINGKPYPTHYLQDILDKVGGISEFQLVINTSGGKVINVVLDEIEKKEALISKIRETFTPEEITVNFVKLENLVRTGWRDKFRYVVNER